MITETSLLVELTEKAKSRKKKKVVNHKYSTRMFVKSLLICPYCYTVMQMCYYDQINLLTLKKLYSLLLSKR